tara:strand:- start:492 stop:1412 length:921 start_codon:yes stop_codon:yes gene_type:complete
MSTTNKFPYLVAFSAAFVAFNAAFFSITGLSHLFSGAFWSVVIMASSLEIGKLVAASFLHRYWKTINNWMRAYLATGVIILVFITSLGIFGYLSKAYQGATVDLNRLVTKLEVFNEQLEVLVEDKEFLKQELEASVNSLPENYITAKRKLREEYNPLIQEKTVKISELKTTIGELEIEMVDTGVDVGPILYVAEAFDSDVNSVVKYLILILIFVFDPLAVTLVIATNVAFMKREEEEKTAKLDSSKDNNNVPTSGKDFNDETNEWYEEDPKNVLDKTIKDSKDSTDSERLAVLTFPKSCTTEEESK